jgi:UDP-GlcNAc:undecaprenyl-phosphate GlcNAc-1-phosphate transferase
LPVVILLKVSIFRIFRLYRGLWTHAGTPEAVRLLRASSTASGGLLVVLVGLRGAGSVPIAILILDWMLTTATTGGGRFGIRALYRVRASNSSDETRILIYGADAYGVLLLRYLRHDVSTTWTVAGFVDPDKCGRRLRGLPVVETPDAGAAAHLAVPVPCSADATLQRDYAQIADEYAPQEVACHRFEMAVGDPSCPAASGGSEAPRGSTTKRQTPSPET